MRSRDAIIDATLALMAERGFAAVTVSAVAERAAVTRQTVYNIFGTKEDLVSQAMLSVALDALRDIEAQLADVPTVPAYLAELFVAARHQLARHPVMAMLMRAEPGNPIFDEGMMGRAVPVATHLLAPVRARDETLADDDRFAALIELTTRLGISFLLFESELTRSDENLRATVGRWLEPMFPGG